MYQGRPKNLLIITNVSMAEKMAGPGIRAWELARALGKHGVPVLLASPFPSQRSAQNVEICQFDWKDIASLATLIEKSDAVLAPGQVIHRVASLLGHPIPRPVIVDLFDIAEIEQAILHKTSPQHPFDPMPANLQEMWAYLHHGDYFITALSRQYDFWVGALLTVGRINQQTLNANFNIDDLLGIVPLGVPDYEPQFTQAKIKGVIPGINSGDKVVYWGGGIWDWTDPISLIHALEIVLQKHSNIRVLFGALKHFDKNTVSEMSIVSRLLALIEEKGWLGKHVFFQDWVPYDEREINLLETDIGVSLHKQTIESHYATRFRLLDHLWSGMPSVLTQGDELADRLEKIGLATLVEPGDIEGIANAILYWIEDGPERAQLRQQTREVAQQMQWANLVNPILSFLNHLDYASDSAAARQTFQYQLPLRRDWERLVEENIALRQEIAMLRRRKVVRLADSVGNFINKGKK